MELAPHRDFARRSDERFRGLPLAGVLMFTDGNRTDLSDLDGSKLAADLSGPSSVREPWPRRRCQSGFDQSDELRIRADRRRRGDFDVGLAYELVVAVLSRSAMGKDSRSPDAYRDRRRQAAGLPIPIPTRTRGVSFYRVQAFPAADERNTEQS